jgi:PBP1b-binding outer membrane lipoprotein LpoB
MKKIILTLLTFGFIFSGCTGTSSNVDTPEMKTSKQVEKELNWKYCEESH